MRAISEGIFKGRGGRGGGSIEIIGPITAAFALLILVGASVKQKLKSTLDVTCLTHKLDGSIVQVDR